MPTDKTIIAIIDIVNIGNSIVQIGVEPPDLLECTDATGTEITGFDGSLLFDGSGLVKILPGRRFVIEESRVNLGQIQNYINNRQITALFQKRTLGNLTDRS